MRPGFSDTSRIQVLAKQRAQTEVLQQWWANKYGLPTEHHLLMRMTPTDLEIAWYTDLYAQLEEAKADYEAHPGKQTRERLQRLEAIVNDEVYSDDPLIDQWERDIAEGREPDLEAL